MSWLEDARARRVRARSLDADARRRRRDRAGVQPPDPAARRRARHPHPGALGPRRLRAPLRPAGRGHVAARDRGRTTRCSRCSPRRASGFTVLAPSQAGGAADAGDDEWVASTTGRSTPGAPTGGVIPSGDGRSDRSSSTTAGSRTTSRSGCARLSSQRCVDRAARLACRSAIAAVVASRPTARRSATTTARATGRWPTRSRVEAPRRGRRRHELAELARERPPDVGGAGPRERVVVRARGRSVEGGLRLPHRRRAGVEPAWRAPLRAALDRMRDHGVEVFERRGGRGAARSVGGPRRLRRRGARRRRSIEDFARAVRVRQRSPTRSSRRSRCSKRSATRC